MEAGSLSLSLLTGAGTALGGLASATSPAGITATPVATSKGLLPSLLGVAFRLGCRLLRLPWLSRAALMLLLLLFPLGPRGSPTVRRTLVRRKLVKVYLPLQGKHRHVVAELLPINGCNPATRLVLLGQRAGAPKHQVTLLQRAVGHQPHQKAQ